MPKFRPIKVEEALHFCLLDFCFTNNPRFLDLIESEGREQVQNFMLRYWVELEEYEKCSAIVKKISSYDKVD